jgi:hypothetical protein
VGPTNSKSRRAVADTGIRQTDLMVAHEFNVGERKTPRFGFNATNTL